MPGPTESAGQGREIPVPTASNQPGSGATGPDAGTNGGRLHLLASAETGDPAALELPLAGPARPEVVLIQSGDYRCPFTQKAEKALAPLLAERKVQRYFLAAPGSPDAGAYVMAVAAAAAQRQGRFWEIHPLLLQMGSDVSEDRLLQAAREVGLDIPTFIKDLQRPELKAHVERQRVLAAALALSATPSFLVNGRLVVGWPGSEVLAQLLDEEAAEVARHVTGDRGLPEVLRQQCGRHPPLAIVMEQGLRFTDPPVHRLDPADEGTRWRVPLRPAAGGIGAEDSPVVVVEYLDPACPHSAKAYRQARALADGNSDVRFVFKLAPRRSDPESLRKSRLAFAAMDRGSFLECADALLAAEVTEETAAAACLGVSPVSPPDESRFAAWLADVRVEALAVAATGTPTIFINGRRLVGALEDAGLLRAMEQERETARELEQRGVAPARIHDWLTSTGRVESFLSPESRPVKCVECPLLADGGPGAREMLVAFDYRSPFSLNLATHLDALLSARSSSIPLTVRLLPWVPGGEENRALAAILVCASRTAPTSVARFHSRLVELHRTDRNREASLLLETLNPTPEETDCRRSAETQRFLRALVDHADHLSVRGTPVVFLDGREVRSQTGLDEDVLRAAVRQAEAAAP